MLLEDTQLILESLMVTVYIVLISGLISIFCGTLIALGLFFTGKDQICEQKFIHTILGSLVSISRSIPFIILMIALIPFTRFIVGTSLGITASIVPLSIAAIPFFARILEGKLLQVNPGIFVAAQSMGLSTLQTIRKVLFPELLPHFINCIIILLVTLIEFSTMAGAMGGGGLGNTVLQYGYYQFNTRIMIEALIVIIVLVLSVQALGNKVTKYFSYPS